MTNNRKRERRTAAWLLPIGLAAIGVAASGCHRKHPHREITPELEEANLLKQLRKSKAFPPLLEEKATELFRVAFEIGDRTLIAEQHAKELPKRQPIECFAAGCIQRLEFNNRQLAESFEQDILGKPESPLHRWPGAIDRGPMLGLPEGGVVETWALLLSVQGVKPLRGLSFESHAEDTAGQPSEMKVVHREEGELR